MAPTWIICARNISAASRQDPPFFSELSNYIFSLGIHSWRIARGITTTKPELDARGTANENLTPDDSNRRRKEK